MSSGQVLARTGRTGRSMIEWKGAAIAGNCMIGDGVAAGARAQLLSPYSSRGFEAAQALDEAIPDMIISITLVIDVEE